jgi:hypothetical protein
VTAPKAVRAIRSARAGAPAAVWERAGEQALDHGIDAAHPLIVDLDATLVTAHSDKEQAAPNFKRGYGFHPLCAFADHGQGGSGEPLAILLRPGNAGSNTAADHEHVLAEALSMGLSGDLRDEVPRPLLSTPPRPLATQTQRSRPLSSS